MLDDINLMTSLVQILSPLLSDDLGVLINPDTGVETTVPAIYLSNNVVPESTFPRVVISWNGFNEQFVTSHRTYEDEGVVYIERNYHTSYSISIAVNSGSVSEQLQANRKSSTYIANKIAKLLKRESIRKQVNSIMNSGIEDIWSVATQTDLDGITILGSSVFTLTFYTNVKDLEEVDGYIETVDHSGVLAKDVEDPNPIIITGSVNVDETP